MSKREPRLPGETSLRTAFRFGPAPKAINTKWPVFSSYKIEWLEEGPLIDYDPKYDDPFYRQFLWEYEPEKNLQYWLKQLSSLNTEKTEHDEYMLAAIEISEELGECITKIELPMGQYIVQETEVIEYYDPFRDKPTLFYLFAKLGQNSKPDQDKILDFVRNNGLLKITNDILHTQLFSLYAFHKYAREAYLILYLYNALESKKPENLKRYLKRFVNDYKEMFEQLAGSGLISKWYPRLPETMQNYILSSRDIEPIDITKISDDDPIKHLLKVQLSQPQKPNGEEFYKSGFWQKFLSKAPEKFLYEVTVELIKNVLDLRIDGCLICSVQVDKDKSGNYRFLGVWNSGSLLSTMWLLFYFKITGHLEYTNPICQFCGEPIEQGRNVKNKLRKDISFHDGCRQTYHNRLKRKVIELWNEGKSIEEIKDQTDANLNQIERWIEHKKKAPDKNKKADALN